METTMLLFVTLLVVAGVFVTLIVRRDFVYRDELERERRRQRLRRPGAR